MGLKEWLRGLEPLTEDEQLVEERAQWSDPGMLPTPSPWLGWPEGWDTPLWGTQLPDVLFSRVSTVFACVDANAKALSSMPIRTRRGDAILPNRSWVENPEPTVYEHGGEAITAIVVSLLMRGNAYIGATAYGNDGWPARWVVIDPDIVKVDNSQGSRLYSIRGQAYNAEQIGHIRYMTWPGLAVSPSPLGVLAANIGAASVLEQYARDLAARGGAPASVLTHPGNLDAKQASDMQERWVSATTSRSGAPAVLSGGITFETLSLSPADMALLDIRTLTEQRICAAMNLTPPPLVGLPGADSLTYSTTVQLMDTFWRLSLSPLGRNIMGALSYFLLPRGSSMEFLEDEFTRPSGLELAQMMETLIRAGIISPDEAKRMLGLPTDTTEEPGNFGLALVQSGAE